MFTVLYAPFDASLQVNPLAHAVLARTKKGREEVLMQSIATDQTWKEVRAAQYESVALVLNIAPRSLQNLILESITDTWREADSLKERANMRQRRRFYSSFKGHGGHGADAWD